MRSTTTYPINTSRSLLEQVLIALLLGAATFVALAILFTVGYQAWYAGRIFPGVSIAGVDVSGLSPSQAVDKINSAFSYPKTGRILLQDQQNGWVTSPQELGVTLDPAGSAQNAFLVGRSGGIFRRLSDQASAWFNGANQAPALIFDQRVAHHFLTELGAQINRPVVEASLSVQGTEVMVKPGEIGRYLDIESTLILISRQVQSLQDGLVPLVIREEQPAIMDASAQAEIARQILSQPLTLTLPEGQPDQAGPWVFDQTTLASMLAIERVQDEQGSRYQITLNSSTLRDFLIDLAPKLQKYPQNARFIFNDDTRQLDIKDNAIIGRTLNIDNSLKAIQEKILGGEHNVALQFDFQEPAVTDQATGEQLGITELVQMQTSYFYGSSRDRVQNITAAASRFHGLLIAPGETFSMASALGEISLDNGYAEALIIVGDRTIKGVGGGVCQVSTTLFRTAFFGGFPIVERHAHAYRVYYYEKVAGNRIDSSLAGLDATVYVPVVDFKFTNDTPYWLLMETYVNPSASSITWKFYSTSDGRSVDWNTTGPVNIVEPPKPLYKENPDLAKDEIKQVDWEAEGADVTVNRTVYRNSAVYLQDRFYTHYQPWQAVYEYGPGTELPEEAQSED